MFVSLAPQKPFQLTLEKFLESHLTPVFWPHWAIFEVRIKPSCDYTFKAGPDLTCSSFRGLNSDNFPFFWILYCSSRTRVTAVGSLVNICWNFTPKMMGRSNQVQLWRYSHTRALFLPQKMLKIAWWGQKEIVQRNSKKFSKLTHMPIVNLARHPPFSFQFFWRSFVRNIRIINV